MTNHPKTDIIIVGGGLVGLTTAAACLKAGLRVTVIEANNDIVPSAEKMDGRSSAIAYGSYLFLKNMGVWKNLNDNAGPILDIRISDSDSTLFLHYSHELVGDEPMGYMVANHDMIVALYETVKDNKNLTLLTGQKWKDIQNDNYRSRITLEDDKKIEASLLIACDGKFSKVREHFSIKTDGWKYKQTGIVCNVWHEHPHEGIAQERFLPSGPFAILPLKDQHQSSLVWTEKTHLAPLFTSMSNEDITAEIARRFGDYLGEVKLASRVYAYPLSLSNAKRYTANRLLLAGDAAHAIHPIAGQGFNLGIRDIEALYPCLLKTKESGLDIGGNQLLSQYESLRQFDVQSLIAITDVLNRLFSNKILPLQISRRLGMAAVHKLPSLKKQLMLHAMGMVSNK